MHSLFTKKYFREYLRLSIAIFHTRFPIGTDYKDHPLWKEFLVTLKAASVKDIVIVVIMYVGDNEAQYYCFPITKNSPTKLLIKNRYFVEEEITI